MSRVGIDGDEVLEVPPIAMATAERLGELVLELFEPDALVRPTDIDVRPWIEERLPLRGIHVYPQHDASMPDMEGFTDPDECTEDHSVIVIRESYWNGIFDDGMMKNRAKTTVLHELGHAILHVPHLIRRRAATPPGALVLRRGTWKEIPPFRNAEWQAWALAGAIAMPRRTLLQLGGRLTVARVASTYGVSEGFARAHLKRLKMEVAR